jgi:2-polyprenyl-3-methyl-5-hydroxy-6-metoxy-1,4-benzoquinol methylase
MKHRTYDKVTSLLNESFPKDQKLKILDYGCGDGRLLEYLDIDRIEKYLGVDINKASVIIAKKRYRYKNVSFTLVKKGETQIVSREKNINAVIAIGVLQYLNDYDINRFIRLCQKVLRKDGVLIFSCATDHVIYRILNIYRYIIPNRFINRETIIKKLGKHKFKIDYAREKGLLVTPLFSNVLVIPLDVVDKIFLGSRGELGFFGKLIRIIIAPLMNLEYGCPFDFGYTLIVSARKI